METRDKQKFIQDKACQNIQSPPGVYVLWSRHATHEMVADNLRRKQVEEALRTCEIIEDYPVLHRPLPDCLVLGWLPTGEPIHMVVAVDVDRDRVFIVTVYRPNLKEWENDWRTRR